MEFVNSQPGLILAGIHCQGFTAVKPQIFDPEPDCNFLEALKEVSGRRADRWFYFRGNVGI
jgi:hypothetical protein